MVDHLLLDDGAGTRESWYELIALPSLQAYYRRVRGHASDLDLEGDDAARSTSATSTPATAPSSRR